jgi:hypothetical protein
MAKDDTSSDNILTLRSSDRRHSVQLPIELDEHDPPTPDQVTRINRMLEDRLSFFRGRIQRNRPAVMLGVFMLLGGLPNLAGYMFDWMPLAAMVLMYTLGLLVLAHMLRVYLEAKRRVALLEEVLIEPVSDVDGTSSLLYLVRQYIDKDVPGLNLYVERLLIQSRAVNSYDIHRIHRMIREKFPNAALHILPAVSVRDDLDNLVVDDQTRLRIDSLFNNDKPSKGTIHMTIEAALRHELTSKLIKIRQGKRK